MEVRRVEAAAPESAAAKMAEAPAEVKAAVIEQVAEVILTAGPELRLDGRRFSSRR
jgi:hypothetical protein